MKILLISNMYPSRKYPHYGIFVKNTEDVLLQVPGVTVDRAVLDKRDGKLSKLIGYLKFYAGAVLRGIFGGYDVIYAHFISHAALPLLLLRTLKPKVKLVLNAHGNDVVADIPKDDKWVAFTHDSYMEYYAGIFKSRRKNCWSTPPAVWTTGSSAVRIGRR